ncbi:MAG: hypothetical protein N5P05_000455 [Chroococcopsis gigantea SAG 12.99]|jgi:osmotically-inducible protein OsmY|nr:BON domain-containing protein [Chlorogloea purpurea SAG 13.99]MDV2998849.1 hypothetical protein [Chroococcopsis gigantea SAG 12.99]
MGWLKRIFGLEKPANPTQVVQGQSNDSSIPAERVGLNGEYDDSGLAKRVVLAFDNESDLADEERLWVAQTGSKVVLKGTVSDQATLTKMISVARGVNGATEVDVTEVTVG